ncbi:hypothetical protein A3A66_02510 [Microgenomates group bacterium RIFCSPLOWO2_01_FULL_46_13]|nr:MAG: hypothetical protein A2783_03235 [Microgenomates group bacterium RIFCSPHIGHO2_01_FULL_45_11]OGV94843.1 MAG: hypothetical protein A3A66_02510 [Microgenomates group bacterium RIFCSPLOWO2_01_FULL_46_13]
MRLRLTLSAIRKLGLGLLLVIVGFGGGYFFGLRQTTWGSKPLVRLVNYEPPVEYQDLDFALFWEVWQRLEKNYLDTTKIDPEKMVYGAIKGMTAALGDPYTVFLPPEENQQAKEDLNGEFGGVGIELGYIKGQLAVMAPLENTPSKQAGIKAGDLILHIKDEKKNLNIDTIGLSLQEAVTYIRGPKGQAVILTLYRQGKGDFEVNLIRDKIMVPSVELDLGSWGDTGWQESAAGDIAWLKLYRFGENTQSQWDEAVTTIIRNRSHLEGIVLDLRNNPGGYFQGAIDVASEFIADGVIVQQQGKSDQETFSVQRRGKLIDLPLVVIINKGSASASEILAGALRDRLDVKLVGERSFGKGTVQDAVDLRNNSGLHITIARWLLPDGDWIHDEGLAPDIEVSLPEATEDQPEPEDTQLKRAIEELKK